MNNLLLASTGEAFGGLLVLILIIPALLLAVMTILMPYYIYRIREGINRANKMSEFLSTHSARQTNALESIEKHMAAMSPNVHDLKEYSKANYNETHQG